MTQTNKQCECRCGYVCGGPGICKVDRCYTKDDGQHYVVDCGHTWGHELIDIETYFGSCSSVVCSSCGLPRIEHDMRNGC